ncbi:uncharacterized protein LOC135955628 [Calliphora vicina]|uniref:uncharacterized protein LOC135955628 n=1 Tax=Calliphora vicina TaxID=7373 RepID=UPI00325AC7B0
MATPDINIIVENLSSSASTNISNLKCSPERSYSDNISRSSSFPTATPDASPKKFTSVKLIPAVNSDGEILSSASTTNVSDSKCSPEHKYSDNISSSSSSPTATPDASPKKITSVKLIPAVNNDGENLSSASTTNVSDSKCSPEHKNSDNISSSSSSHMATPDVYNVGENLFSAVSTPIVSESKCLPVCTFSDKISSSSSSHTATHDFGENLFSAVSTSIVSDSKCSSERKYSDSIYSSSPSATPDVSPRKISSVKLIRAFNNAGENLTYLSLSPTATDESSLSSAVLTPNVRTYIF